MSEITIKRQIEKGYRAYALHVIESRGIPNWYDSITNGQRILIDNCPSSYTKTLSVVGSAISSGYHSGDASLVSTINKLARQFNCSEPIMSGDGFFGCPVSPSAASARYTSVKLNPKIREIIKRYYHLNVKNEEGLFNHLVIDVPIGLCSGIMGIAVGYKSTILPRKIEDMRDYMEGKRKKVTPHFKGFKGTVKKYGDDKTWIIEGIVEVDESKRTIRVTAIPPMMRFDAFLKKLNSIVHDTTFDFQNNSSDDVDVTVKIHITEPKDVWDRVKESIIKATKMIVYESIVFVRDKTVIEYEKLEDYLLDFSEENQKTLLSHLEWTMNEETDELRFMKAKVEYLKFLMQRKRSQLEMDAFLDTHEPKISTRLEGLKIRTLNTDEVTRTEEAIAEQKKKLRTIRAELDYQIKIVDSLKPKLRGKRIKPAESLFDATNVSGIEIFSVDEEQEEQDAL